MIGEPDDGRLIRNVAAVAGIILVLGASVVLVRTSRRHRPPSVLGIRTTNPSPSEGVIAFPTPETSVVPFPTTLPSASPSPSRSPRTVSGACRNSFDPACGPFHWRISPGSNSGMTISVSGQNLEPAAGETVTFVVTISDPDAEPWRVWPRFGDTEPTRPPGCTEKRYGAWDPPPRSGGTKSFTFKHVYRTPGTYRASFIGQTGGCYNPYFNELTVPLRVRVGPANTTEPSPSPSPSQTPFPI